VNHTENDTYDASRGPVPTPRGGGRKTSARQMRVPVDLGRSRRSGLRRTVCVFCNATVDQGYAHHTLGCPVGSTDDARRTQRTGPLAPDQTSVDTGWFS
jgi:hypothetical protein